MSDAAKPPLARIVLVRHGETEWSASGKHTGRTDVPLTERGQATARALAGRLAGHAFATVWSSPLARARDTAHGAGFDALVGLVDELVEWDYGEYEGRTTAEIRVERPGWTVWEGGCPGGETIEAVGARADRVIERVLELHGDVLVFSHGHFSRVLAARWIGLAPEQGARFALATGAISTLGWERETPVIERWNEAAEERPR